MTTYLISYTHNDIAQVIAVKANDEMDALCKFSDKGKSGVQIFNIREIMPDDIKPGLPILE